LQTYKAPTAPVSAENLYTIKSGDTLSAIAKAKGTTVSELMKANPSITNANLIYAGKSLTLPNAPITQGNVPDYSKVNSMAEANNAINANQEFDAAAAKVDETPPVKKTTEEIMAEITTAIKPTTTKPAAIDLTTTLLGYRSEYGVTALETQLDQLRAQEQDLLAQKETRTAAERGKPVAMNVIEGRVSEIERQENERIGVVQRSIANATNQLNTKYNIVSMLMKTKETDYDNAVTSYDKEMSNNISIFNAAKSIDEANKTEQERQQDNARSNAQIIINTMNDRDVTYDKLSPDEQTNLTKLGIQSGLGSDFFSSVMKISAGKNILTTITSADDTKASIIYKDGTVKTISTGLPAKPVSGLTKTEQKEAQMTEDRHTIMSDVGRITGEDRKVDPVKMQALRQDIALNNPELLSWFDNAYEPKNMLNPANYPKAVRENQWLNK
jgi:hypothetical protein